MNDLSREDVARLRALLEAATPGPWQMLCDEIAWSLDGNGRTGVHKQRRIFTEWHHPQAKGPLGVVNIAAGIGDKATGGGPAYFVHIDEADASLIAAAVNALPALLSLAEAVMGAPVGECVEVGDDESGQPMALIHSTREELAKGPPLAYRRVRLVREE